MANGIRTPEDIEMLDQMIEEETPERSLEDLYSEYRQTLERQPEPIDESGLQEARDRQNYLDRIAVLNQSVGGLGEAVARSVGGSAPDVSGITKLLQQQGSRGVAEAREDIAGQKAQQGEEAQRLAKMLESIRQQQKDERSERAQEVQEEYLKMNKYSKALQNRQTQQRMARVDKEFDPASRESENARQNMRSLLPEQFRSAITDDMSKAEIEEYGKKVLPMLDKKAAREFKTAQKLDDKVSKFSKELERTNIPQMTSAVERVESLISEAGDDLPGYGRGESLIPDVAAGEKARELRQAIQSLFNVVLKDRSGTAVAKTEFERLQKEFGEGTFKTEQEVRKGLQNYIKRLKEVARNQVAGVDEDVVKIYQERGGADFVKQLEGAERGISGKKQMSEQDKAAKKWAESNPGDSRAEAILEKLKRKGF